MELILLAIGGAGAVVAGLRARTRLRRAHDDRDQRQAELSAIRHLSEADAVLFGEQLSRLDARVDDDALDDDGRADYQAALDAYEAALRLVDRLATTDDVSKVVDTLAAGRYAVACVTARIEGTPAPQLRTPCFFDPRHGPAHIEVLWNVPREGTRKVPACAQDAARLAAGAEPELTTIRVDGRDVPYWAAGGLHGPYEKGYTPRSVSEAMTDQRAQHLMQNDPNQQFGGFSI
jgi:hypothetical protein